MSVIAFRPALDDGVRRALEQAAERETRRLGLPYVLWEAEWQDGDLALTGHLDEQYEGAGAIPAVERWAAALGVEVEENDRGDVLTEPVQRENCWIRVWGVHDPARIYGRSW